MHDMKNRMLILLLLYKIDHLLVAGNMRLMHQSILYGSFCQRQYKNMTRLVAACLQNALIRVRFLKDRFSFGELGLKSLNIIPPMSLQQ